MEEYDAGLLNDWGGGNVGWWHDYLRYEIGCANSHWVQQTESLRAELAETQTVKDSFTVPYDYALLLDENAAMREEIGELRDACAEKQRCIDSSVAAQRDFLAEIDALRAELAACREDAERYRWLRKSAHVDSMMRHVSYVRFIQLNMSPANMVGNDEKDIDTAIDAARKGEGGMR